MIRLMRTVSLWRCLRPPASLTQGFSVTFQASLELLRDGFGYKGAQWDATLRGHRFGAAEDGVGNLEGGLHPVQGPIFMGGSQSADPQRLNRL